MTFRSTEDSNLLLRPVTVFDLYQILKWRNDKTTRFFSRDHKSISYRQHLLWYLSNCIKSDQFRYISILDRKRVCFINFARIPNQDEFCISINMNPKYRGMNLSSRILALAETQILKDYGNCLVVAQIRTGNNASLNLFLGSNYSGNIDKRESFCILSKSLKVKSKN